MTGAGLKWTDGFIRPELAEVVHRPDGTTDRTKLPAVWTLVHRGYSGSERFDVAGRLDVWVYRTKAEALLAGARLAMDCGLDEDPTAVQLFSEKNYAAVLRRYEETHREGFLLRVQSAFLQPPGLPWGS